MTKTAPTAKATDASRRDAASLLSHGIDYAPMQRLLGYNLARAAVPSFKIFAERIGKPFQLSRLDFTILMLVGANPGVTQREMSDALDVVAPRLTLVLDKLDERRLITRTPSEDDRRKRFIALTSEGVALVEEAGRVADHMEHELLEHLSDRERASLFRLLKKVAKYRAP